MTIFPVDGVSGGKIIVAENRNASITIETDQDEEPAAKNRSTNKQETYHQNFRQEKLSAVTNCCMIYRHEYVVCSDTNFNITHRLECVVSAHKLLRDIYTRVFCFSSDTNYYIAYRPECVVLAHRQTDT